MIKYEMQAADRKLTEAEAREILDAGEYCVIATVDADGIPYGVPLSYAMRDGKLYIHTTVEAGHKFDNFARDNRVCVTVATEVEPCYEDTFFTSRFASVIAHGRIRRVEDAVLRRKVLVDLCMKYLPEFKHEIGGGIQREFDITAIWEVEFDDVAGKGARRHPKQA